jgi:hypothetical protein
MCDDTEPTTTISVFPSDLKNKLALETILEKRVTIGKPLRLPIEPSSGGDISSNEFVLAYTLDGQENKAKGTNPLQITVPCIPKSLNALRTEIKWVYDPPGSQYTEDVVLFDRTVNQAKQSSPEILIANTTENFDTKAMKLVVSGIEVAPPRIDCNVTAQDKDVKVDIKLDKPSLGKYHVLGSIEPEGSGRYRIILQLKGPRTKFDGDNVDVSITASVGGVSISETKTVSIPAFR